MQFSAVLLQPGAGALHFGKRLTHQTPETLAVVHFAKMSDFMGGNIIEDM